jgi:hypothetical protein
LQLCTLRNRSAGTIDQPSIINQTLNTSRASLIIPAANVTCCHLPFVSVTRKSRYSIASVLIYAITPSGVLAAGLCVVLRVFTTARFDEAIRHSSLIVHLQLPKFGTDYAHTALPNLEFKPALVFY